jgi:O-succinylbenzoic acid--CoA ligase
VIPSTLPPLPRALATGLSLHERASRYGRRPAIRSPQHEITYADLPDAVAAVAAWLRGIGVVRDDYVALAGTARDADRAGTLLAVMALASLGATAVLLPPRAPARQQEELLARCGPVRATVVTEQAAPVGEVGDVGSSEAIDSGDTPDRQLGGRVPLPALGSLPRVAGQPRNSILLTARVSVLFTSGSSGTAKAVVHSLANHLFSAVGSASNIPLRATDTWLACLPLSHIGGLSILFRTLCVGACTELSAAGRFTDERRTEVAALRRATHVSLVETQLQRVLDLPPDVLAHRPRLLVGGSAVRRVLIDAARSRNIPLHASYGSTELCSQVATTGPTAAGSFASDGKIVAAAVLPYREVSVDAAGQVLLRGPTLCEGYLVNGQVRPAADARGWYHSGDRGRIIRDGRLAILGRHDSLFISGGENVQPEAVEAVLSAYPGVLRAACVAVPDDEYGARPAAFLDTGGDPVPPADLAAWLLSRLSPFQIPVAYLPFPPGETGKPNRLRLAALAARTLQGRPDLSG